MATLPTQPQARIGVTGATGFIGQHLIRQALELGYVVRAMVRTPQKLGGLSHPNLEIHQAGLGEDDAAFCDGCKAVIHLAGLIKAKSRREFDVVNVTGAKNLAYIAQTAGVSRIVLISSITARAPELSDYAGSKYEGEQAVKAGFEGALAVVRAPAVFGPGDEATAPFMDLILKGMLPTAGGRGWRHRKLALVAVEDIARDILVRGLSGEYDGKTVSPCNVEAVTWPEFGQMAARAANRQVRVIPIPLSIIYPVAAVTSVTSRLLNMGHLTLGKLQEFLYEDWSSEDVIQDAPPMEDRLRETLRRHTTKRN